VGTVLLVVVLVVVVAVVGFGVALARKGKRKYAEQGGGLAPNAPREWAGAHTPEAKLHRRLVAAAKSLNAQPMGDAVAIERRVAIEQRILQLDQELVAVAGNANSVAEIEPLVAAVEQAVTRQATSGLDLLPRDQAELDAGEDR
jgi:hypothetical protein